MGNITPLHTVRKRAIDIKVNKQLHADIARSDADAKSTGKRLAHFFALQNSNDLQYLGGWLRWDGEQRLWRACRDEHIRAAEALCKEAEKVMGGRGLIDNKAMVREVLRLAAIEPGFRKGIDLRLLDPDVKRRGQ